VDNVLHVGMHQPVARHKPRARRGSLAARSSGTIAHGPSDPEEAAGFVDAGGFVLAITELPLFHITNRSFSL
jgi:hypothetical protein